MKAIYAGSFDPVTYGHLWVMKKGVQLFGDLEVVIGTNPLKKSMFTFDERADLIRSSMALFMNSREHYKLSVTALQGEYVVHYARKAEAKYILRGLRNASDFEFEWAMRQVNGDLDDRVGAIETVFLMPPRELAEVSSSFVKSLVGFDGWEYIVAKYAPPEVVGAFRKKVEK